MLAYCWIPFVKKCLVEVSGVIGVCWLCFRPELLSSHFTWIITLPVFCFEAIYYWQDDTSTIGRKTGRSASLDMSKQTKRSRLSDVNKIEKYLYSKVNVQLKPQYQSYWDFSMDDSELNWNTCQFLSVCSGIWRATKNLACKDINLKNRSCPHHYSVIW